MFDLGLWNLQGQTGLSPIRVSYDQPHSANTLTMASDEAELPVLVKTIVSAIANNVLSMSALEMQMFKSTLYCNVHTYNYCRRLNCSVRKITGEKTYDWEG